MKKTNIVLIGFMGSGKTTIAKAISKKLKFSVLDTDVYIQNKYKMSIKSMFNKFGEEYFRHIESDVCKEISSFQNIIISTGGGIIKNPINIENLKSTAIIVYLDLDFKTSYNRIKNTNRPLVASNSYIELRDLYYERKSIYKQYADIKIDIKKSVTFNTNEVIKHLYLRGHL